jgi:hypothetical protein
MLKNRIAQLAIVLWVATVAVLGWMFVHGHTVSGSDGRQAIVLDASERDLVLGEMRGMLVATQGVVQGIQQNDMKRVAQSARAAGMGAAVDVNPALMAKLPLEFKSLGMNVHHEMDSLAAAAEQGQASSELLGMLSATLAKCVACHASWQLQARTR